MIVGSDGADDIDALTGSDKVDGGAGNDRIAVRVDGTDAVEGGLGTDHLVADGSAYSHWGGDSIAWYGTDAAGNPLGADYASGFEVVQKYVETATTNQLLMRYAGWFGYANGASLTFTGVENLDLAASKATAGNDLMFVRGTGSYDAGNAGEGYDTIYADLSAMTTPVRFESGSDETYHYLGSNFHGFDRFLIATGSGDDYVNSVNVATALDDHLLLGAGANVALTGAGNDYISAGDDGNGIDAGPGSDTVISGDGADVIKVDTGSDAVVAGGGDDDIRITIDGTDTVSAGGGTDHLVADGSAYSHWGGDSMAWYGTDAAGNPLSADYASGFEVVQKYVETATTNQLLMRYAGWFGYANGASLTFTGVENLDLAASKATAGNDLMFVRGTGSYDAGNAGEGYDAIFADLSAMTTPVRFEAGSDETYHYLGSNFHGFDRFLIATGSGDDYVNSVNVATALDDHLLLGDGNDTAITGAGNDYIDAGPADDLLNAGPGTDKLTGGAGNDVFVYAAAGNDIDRITDFAEGDVLRIDGANLSAASFVASASGLVANQINISSSNGITTVQLGTDATVGADVVIQLQGTYAATAFGASGADVYLTSTTPINHPPTGFPTAVLAGGVEDTAYTLQAGALLMGFTDPDGDVLKVQGLQPTHGSVQETAVGSGVWTFTPEANYHGLVGLTYDVVDGRGGVLPVSQSFTLASVNDPAALGSADLTLQETNEAVSTNGRLSISDVDSPATFVAQPGTGGKFGVFSLASDGAWTYKAWLANDYLNPGDSLQDRFTVTSADGSSSTVTVTIAGTAETSTVKLGDAPTRQSGTGGQWEQAWTQAGYVFLHKADASISVEVEPWTPVKFNSLGSSLLSGGDIFSGDLGVSGQTAVTSTTRQEIDGTEGLRLELPMAAQSVTIKLSSLYSKDDGTAYSESGRLRLLDASGHVVAQTVFLGESEMGTKTITLSAAGGFTSLELVAGAQGPAGAWGFGAYSYPNGAFGVSRVVDAVGTHGSDYLIDSIELTLMGQPSGGVLAPAAGGNWAEIQ